MERVTSKDIKIGTPITVNPDSECAQSGRIGIVRCHCKELHGVFCDFGIDAHYMQPIYGFVLYENIFRTN